MTGEQERQDHVRRAAQAALDGTGLLVDDLKITQAGRRRLVRIAVDDDLSTLPAHDETSPVPPVSLDAVAEASRRIDAALDTQDVLGTAPYVLEVTSPGVSRPLTLPRHFRRNVGRLARVERTDGRTSTGRIVAVGAAGVHLDDPATAPIAYADICKARVEVEFARLDTPAAPPVADPNEQED